jgi:hypothetical protein
VGVVELEADSIVEVGETVDLAIRTWEAQLRRMVGSVDKEGLDMV